MLVGLMLVVGAVPGSAVAGGVTIERGYAVHADVGALGLPLPWGVLGIELPTFGGGTVAAQLGYRRALSPTLDGGLVVRVSHFDAGVGVAASPVPWRGSGGLFLRAALRDDAKLAVALDVSVHVEGGSYTTLGGGRALSPSVEAALALSSPVTARRDFIFGATVPVAGIVPLYGDGLLPGLAFAAGAYVGFVEQVSPRVALSVRFDASAAFSATLDTVAKVDARGDPVSQSFTRVLPYGLAMLRFGVIFTGQDRPPRSPEERG